MSIVAEQEGPEIPLEKSESSDYHLPRKGFMIAEAQADKLDRIAERLNVRGRTQALSYLIGAYLQSTGGILPIASFENLMFDETQEDTSHTPIAIVAKPKGGKSTTLDSFLQKCAEKGIPFIVFCQKTEPFCFSWIARKKKYSNFNAVRAIRSSKTIQLRVDLSPDEQIRLTEVERISQDLIRLQTDKHLKPWVLVFDEGSSYTNLDSFLRMLREMRKYARRIITTSTESGLLKMCEEYAPLPREAK